MYQLDGGLFVEDFLMKMESGGAADPHSNIHVAEVSPRPEVRLLQSLHVTRLRIYTGEEHAQPREARVWQLAAAT